jgi:predicted nucleotidyltransferase
MQIPASAICYHLRMEDSSERDLEAIRRAAQATPGLDLLMVFGSRARGEAHARSDWDFGYLAGPSADVSALMAALVEATHNDRVDLVDLGRASGVLRFHAARDGQVLHEQRPGVGDEFRLEAAHFWCDMAPILERGHDEVLAGLHP